MTLVRTVVRKARWPPSSNHRDCSPHHNLTSSRIGNIEQIGLNPKARIDIHLFILPRQTHYINPHHLLWPMKWKGIRFWLWWQRASRSIFSHLSGRRRMVQILSRLTIALWSPKLLRSLDSQRKNQPLQKWWTRTKKLRLNCNNTL
jgi:hypothetical protein